MILVDGLTTYMTFTSDLSVHRFTLNSVLESDLGPHQVKLRSYFLYPPANTEITSFFEVFTVTLTTPCSVSTLLNSVITQQVHVMGAAAIAYQFAEV